jgi:hypothetical protein
MIGTHTVTLYPDPTGAGAGVALSCPTDELTIRHGRDDTDSQPESATVTIEISLAPDTEPLPPQLEVGAGIRVTTTLSGVPTPYDRFAGRVTDIAQQWEDAGTETPDRVTVQIIAAAPLADVGRRVVGDTPFPQELDGARVTRVMSLAGVTLDPLFSDPGTVQILGRDIDSRAALEVAQSTAESAGGIIWHTRAGLIRYADADHRRGTQPALFLDACDVLVTPTWRRTTEGLINKVSIGYGATPEAGEQPRYVSERADSQTRYGRYELSATTELAAAADAQRMGDLLLTRNHDPVWVMSDLPIAVKDLTLTQTQALLALEVGSLVDLTGLPASGAAPTSAALWVEGWTERLLWGDHEISLSVSGFCRTAPAPRWNDVDPARTWDTFPGTWDDATCLGPTTNRGRWDDVAAAQRWDTLPPALTWDTWPT